MAHPARWRVLWFFRRRHLTLFGRSVVLVGCELLANAICWIVAGILFGGRKDTQPILSLALLAWVCAALFVSESIHNKFFGFPS
jgi:high-affinity nickel-transport protein